MDYGILSVVLLCKSCVVLFSFHPNTCILRVPLFWEFLTLWYTQADFPFFQAACQKSVITLMSQHDSLYQTEKSVENSSYGEVA